MADDGDDAGVFVPPLGDFAEDVLHHHHGAVHDDSEIDGSDGEQVRRDVAPVEADERKEQRERDGGRDNQRGAHAEQKKSQDDEHQQHSAQQVAFNRLGGFGDQKMAIVKRHYLDVRRQDVLIDVVGLPIHPLEHSLRLLAHAHQDDALHRVVLLHVSEFAQPRGVTHLHLRDVVDVNRDAVVLRQDDVADVGRVPDQAEPPNVVKLAALRIEAAARIRVVVAQLLRHLADGNAVLQQFVRIEQHLVLHGRAAEAGVVGHALNGAVAAFEHPVLDVLQFLRRAVGALQNIAVDQAAGAEKR